MTVLFAYKIWTPAVQRNQRRVDVQSVRKYDYQNISKGPNEIRAASRKHPGNNSAFGKTTTRAQRKAYDEDFRVILDKL